MRRAAGMGGPHEQGVGAPLRAPEGFLSMSPAGPSPAPASPLRGSGGPGVGGAPTPRCAPPSPSLTCAGDGKRGDRREGPSWLLCWPGPEQPLRRGPTGPGQGPGAGSPAPPACPELGGSAKRRLGLCSSKYRPVSPLSSLPAAVTLPFTDTHRGQRSGRATWPLSPRT